MESFEKAARNILINSMELKRDETILVVTDEFCTDIGNVLFDEAKKFGAESVYLEFKSRSSHGEEPPMLVAEAMKEADVAVIPTSKSISHTRARKDANNMGTRIATMPGVTKEIIARTLGGSIHDIAKKCTYYAELLSCAEEITIRTPAGTNLQLSVSGRNAVADTGLIHSSGSFGNLPGGEAFIAPVEKTANGVLVVDGSMAGIGRLKEPIKMRVHNGYVTEISEGGPAESLERILNKYGNEARNIAELGIGLNDRAELSGNPIEDEKVIGTVHIGLGNNCTFGGVVYVPSHLDGIMLSPTLIIDGETVIENGVLKH